MTCPTCEAPPTEPLPKQGPHHVAVRFGDTGGMGQAVLYRGNVVTAVVVEAMAGPPGAGWVEMWLCDADGTPIIHKAAPRQCSDCDAELAEDQADEDGCEACGYVGPSYRAWQAHVATSVRHGHVAILSGRELITAPAAGPVIEARVVPSATPVEEQARALARALPTTGAEEGAPVTDWNELVRAELEAMGQAVPEHLAADPETAG